MKRSAVKYKGWQDHYTRRAQKEAFPARSVFKLKEIQQKMGVMAKDGSVLDLGCAPGAWLKYAAQIVGRGGRVVGVDLKTVDSKLPDHVKVLKGDLLLLDDALWAEMGTDFNVVLSDMAPSTTGNKAVDAARSHNLCEAALHVAQQVLQPGGNFVCKIFQGGDFQVFTAKMRTCFAKVKIFKPQSSRKRSKEIYVIGLGKRS